MHGAINIKKDFVQADAKKQGWHLYKLLLNCGV